MSPGTGGRLMMSGKVSLQVNGLRPFAIRPYPDGFAF